MNENQIHYVKLKKSVPKGYILHDNLERAKLKPKKVLTKD